MECDVDKRGTNLLWCGTQKPTNLYPIRYSVQAENESEYKKLKERPYHFTARDSSRGPRAKDLIKTHVSRVCSTSAERWQLSALFSPVERHTC